MSARMIIMANNIDEVGGAQRVAHSLAQGFANRGFQVELVGVVPHEPCHQFTEDPAYRSITLAERPLPSASDPAGRKRARTSILHSLQALLDSGEPGIIITTQLWAMEHLEEVDHRGWRIIGQYHSSIEAAAGGRDLSRAQKSYADVDSFVLLTHEDAVAFRRAGLDNTCWIPNAVSVRPDEPAALSTRVLSYLGRLSPEKGPQFLIEAWGRLASQHPDWTLRIVGNGPDEPAIRAMVDRLPEGAERVKFTPPVTDPERVLLESDIVVLPSLVEGFPLVVAEAMACGVPVVASDCSAGVRALIDDGVAGLIAARGDAGDLAHQLTWLMESESLRREFGAAARERAEWLSPEAIFARWELLFADVLR
jgi:glycosyltransferase involved in cell wall biosynthesis